MNTHHFRFRSNNLRCSLSFDGTINFSLLVLLHQLLVIRRVYQWTRPFNNCEWLTHPCIAFHLNSYRKSFSSCFCRIFAGRHQWLKVGIVSSFQRIISISTVTRTRWVEHDKESEDGSHSKTCQGDCLCQFHSLNDVIWIHGNWRSIFRLNTNNTSRIIEWLLVKSGCQSLLVTH